MENCLQFLFEPKYVVFPINALNLPSKSYSGLEFPTKSKTVKQSLPSANLNPRPNCWRKTVKLSVGLKNKIVSISGISTPSLKISTTNKIVDFFFLEIAF